MAKKDIFSIFKLNIPGVDKFLPTAACIILTIIFFTLLIPIAWHSTIDFFVGIFTSAPVMFVGEGAVNTASDVGSGIGSAWNYVVDTVSGWMPGEEEAVIDGTTGAEISVEEAPLVEELPPIE